MEKFSESNISNYNHALNIIERKNIYISGVSKIDSFDDEEFLIETTMGYMAIKGKDLEIVKLDTKEGTISIKGLLISMSYIEELKKMKKENSIFNKMFK